MSLLASIKRSLPSGQNIITRLTLFFLLIQLFSWLPIAHAQTPPNQPPVAQDKNTAISNNTSVQIPALSAQDTDGSVVSYTVSQLPPTNQGQLYWGDPAAGGTLITEGQLLTPAQISSLYFQPHLEFGGEAIFNYQAQDDQGSESNTAKVTITVTVPPVNQPPVADDKSAPSIPNDKPTTQRPRQHSETRQTQFNSVAEVIPYECRVIETGIMEQHFSCDINEALLTRCQQEAYYGPLSVEKWQQGIEHWRNHLRQHCP